MDKLEKRKLKLEKFIRRRDKIQNDFNILITKYPQRHWLISLNSGWLARANAIIEREQRKIEIEEMKKP